MENSGGQFRENWDGKGKRRKKQGKKQGRNEKKRKRESGRKKKVEIKKVAEEWEIWDEEEKAARLEAGAKKMVPEKFH